jgi:DNA-binding MarR family transcriptional regulator
MENASESKAQQLGKAFMRMNKAFIHFHRAGLEHGALAQCSPSEFRVLLCLGKWSPMGRGELKVTEISKLLHITSPSVTQVVKTLEQQGLIERHFDPNDRRSVVLKLSQEGQRLTQEATVVFEEALQDLIEYLGEEESTQFVELLRKSAHFFTEHASYACNITWNGVEEAK